MLASRYHSDLNCLPQCSKAIKVHGFRVQTALCLELHSVHNCGWPQWS